MPSAGCLPIQSAHSRAAAGSQAELAVTALPPLPLALPLLTAGFSHVPGAAALLPQVPPPEARTFGATEQDQRYLSASETSLTGVPPLPAAARAFRNSTMCISRFVSAT